MNRSDFIHDVLKPYYNNLHNIVKDNNESLQHLQQKYRKIITTIKTPTISNNYGKELIKDFKNVGNQYVKRLYLKNKKRENGTKSKSKSMNKTKSKQSRTFKKTPRWR